ncbi:unnamed protein product [Darwinula stevensoni]|uniref:Fibronectin type-III domain-containing protein n=1 Tax=Darwinula stevensoni TaxID=69355 RepID=A0A7R9A237_9CRUS|nr:unnamed protein product [Darwinula stevensoni]CAG0888961.1 unnamed protein product [Darwinula stevensoni]
MIRIRIIEDRVISNKDERRLGDLDVVVPYQPNELRIVNRTATTISLNWAPPRPLDNYQEPFISYELYWNDTYLRWVFFSISLQWLAGRSDLWLAAMAPVEQATLRPIVYYDFLQGHSARAAADNICAAFEGKIVHYSTVSRWLKRFESGDTTFGNRPRSGRPSTVDDEALRNALNAKSRTPPLANRRLHLESPIGPSATEVHHRSIMALGTGTQEYVLTDLYPNNEYQILISAKSRRGEGVPTFPLIVSTENYVPSEPREIKVTAVNFTSILVEWKPPRQDGHHKFIVGYKINIHGGHVGDKTLHWKPQSSLVMKSSVLTHSVTNLQPNSTYQVQVAAMTRNEESSTVAINATWTNPSGTYGQTKGWRIRYGTRPTYCVNMGHKDLEELNMKEIILNGSEKNEITVHGLEKGFKYEFRLAGGNDIGYGQEAFTEFTTPEGPPTSPPTNISFNFITSSIIMLKWDVPESSRCHGRILGYTLRFIKKMDESLILERNMSTPKMVMTGLEEDTSYYFRISANTIGGIGPFSERMYLTTIPEIVRAVRNVRAKATSNDSLEVWWDDTPRRSIVGFRIYYTRNEADDLDLWAHKDVQATYSAELKHLEHFAIYYIQVSSRTKEGHLGQLSKMIQVEVRPQDVPKHVQPSKTYPFYDDDGEWMKTEEQGRSSPEIYVSWEGPNAFEPLYYKVQYGSLFHPIPGSTHQ